ncbi:response regulator aspartate phosphatase B [Alkalihalobacillus xiaoxiensis]|uniref:Response regulator aspartate phosphatase B n=1 Tax=Shouchella xiaoxiensis TaxID=766895 RepID=A0ABS2SWM0_9BACI|nr:Rap family tetratricopeptide repeat protein [Shouchella xiaoxiensis]MBM7839396.1 response regulator aspartate phosphatase B [Shouchella xiaoxiensis]
MTYVLRAEEVGVKITEWYSCIVARSYEEAVLMKEEVKQLLPQMENNDKMLAYYSLVDYRHNMLTSGYNKNELDEELPQVEELENLDHTLRYFYYFVSGQHEFMQERYRSAVKLFSQAERLLEHVNDKAEEAEFYQYTGYMYYRLNQYLLASSYMERAKYMYDQLKYVEPALNCKIVLAFIFQELHNAPKSEVLLLEALKEAEGKRIMTAQIYRSLGLNKLSIKDYPEAESYFRRALEIEEHRSISLGAKTLYNLSNTLFRMGKYDEASIKFKTAKASAEYYGSKEYVARCKVTEGLYLLKDYSLVDEGIEDLNTYGLDFELAEVAEEAADQTEKEGNTTLALKYLRIAHKARLYQNSLGDDQE